MTETAQGQSAIGRRWLIWGIVLAYAVFTLALLLHHEPWRDEADVWLAVRDMSVGELFHWLRYCGSPGLWHAIVMVPAKLGWPYRSMGILHWALAVVTAALVMFRAPFPLFARVLIVFSSLLGYEYAVIARSYVLTALLMALLAIEYRRRLDRPILFGILLALLLNTNVHGGIIAGCILGAAGVDALARRKVTRRVWAGVAIACVGAIVAAAQLLPAPADGQLQGYTTLRNPRAAGHVLGRAFLPQIPHSLERIRAATGAPEAAVRGAYVAERVFGTLAFGSVLWFLWRRHRQGFWIVVVSSVLLCYLFTFKWMGGDRHTGLFWLICGFALWIARTDQDGDQWPALPRVACVVLGTSLAYSTLALGVTAVREWTLAFSGAEEVAGYLQESGLARRPMAAYSDAECSAILPYLPGTRFWYLGMQAYGTAMPWDLRWEAGTKLPVGEILRRLEQQFPGPASGAVFISSNPLSDPSHYGLSEVFRSSRPMFPYADERYFVYLPEDAAKPPDGTVSGPKADSLEGL